MKTFAKKYLLLFLGLFFAFHLFFTSESPSLINNFQKKPISFEVPDVERVVFNYRVNNEEAFKLLKRISFLIITISILYSFVKTFPLKSFREISLLDRSYAIFFRNTLKACAHPPTQLKLK